MYLRYHSTTNIIMHVHLLGYILYVLYHCMYVCMYVLNYVVIGSMYYVCMCNMYIRICSTYLQYVHMYV